MLVDSYEDLNPLNPKVSGFANRDKMQRHPMFRMPNWMSDDDDMTNLTSRMSHGPNWAFGNREPWNETQNQKGNGNINRGEAVAHTIPIKIEAEAPPGCMPQERETETVNNAKTPEISPTPKQERINPDMKIGNQPAYASKTSPAVDSCIQEEISRDTRSSSAPPEVKNQDVETPRFISKINITPQQPQNQSFNNVTKPFSTSPDYIPVENSEDVVDSTKNIQNQNMGNNVETQNKINDQPYLQKSNVQNQKPSVIRNIPILFEDQDSDLPHNNSKPMTPPSSQSNHPKTSNWGQQFGNIPNRFHDEMPSRFHDEMPNKFNDEIPSRFHEEMFQDPFFGFNRFGSPTTQRRSQQMPHKVTPHDIPHQEQPANFQQQPHFPQTIHEQPANFHQRTQRTVHEQPANFQQQKCPQTSVHVQPQDEIREHNKPSQKDTETNVNQIPTTIGEPNDVKMEKLNKIRDSVSEYQQKVLTFQCIEKNKEYRYLDEMLTRLLLELDNIETNGRDDIRQARRNLVKDINLAISTLEKKLVSVSGVIEPKNGTECKEHKLSNESIQENKKSKIDDTDTNKDQPMKELPPTMKDGNEEKTIQTNGQNKT